VKVTVYAAGLVCCSACAPADMDRADVEVHVNHTNPTGVASPWTVSDEPFRGGEPNPSPCNTDEGRVHWLLSC
jgi:hypothetical protein